MARPTTFDPLLRLEAVRLTLMSQAGPVNILNGIDLSITKGEAVGLVGPSGSGKSTMLMVMAGLERPTSGKVTIAGQTLSSFDEDAAARFRRGNVGIVFQSFHLIPTMTALENVAVPLELSHVEDAFDKAREELKAVGLGHRLDHFPSQLSGGEQQRVALARATAPKPAILFADEPTGNLDRRTGSEIMDLLFAFQRERQATFVLVTHDEELTRHCNRVVRLRDGLIESIEQRPLVTPPPVAAEPVLVAAAAKPIEAVVSSAPLVVEPTPPPSVAKAPEESPPPVSVSEAAPQPATHVHVTTPESEIAEIAAAPENPVPTEDVLAATLEPAPVPANEASDAPAVTGSDEAPPKLAVAAGGE